jgi:Cof subfamily protein (haloacid dehalogenase superfamily)
VLSLVATDLDGTLLRSDGSVGARTVATLEALDERGVLVVFVTGRPVRWMEALWQHVGAHGLAICSNGGVVYDVAAGAMRSYRTIPVEIGLDVVERLRAGIPGTTFAVERTTGFAKEPTYVERHALPPGAPVGPMAEVFDDHTVKLLARHDELDAETFWQQAQEIVGHVVTTTWSSTGAMVEISAFGVTKAATLAMLAEEHGFGPDDAVAFGDMPNDLPMLEWAGTSYAMAGAHPSVLELAEHVAPGNDEDGVAQVLERLFAL